MPRTRRTPASETPAEDAAQVEAPPVPSDTPLETSSDTASTETKTPRRRAPRLPKAETPVADAGTEPPADAPASPAPPRRRRGSRTATPEPASVSEPAPVEPPAAPRRRGRRTATPETAVLEVSPTASADDVPDVEAPVTETAVPAPARRRGRARQTAEATAVAEDVQPEPAAEAPSEPEAMPDLASEEPSSRRRRGRRRSGSTPVTAEAEGEATLDVEAPVIGAEIGEEAETDADGEAEKPGKRSRRSRRRRGGMEEVTTEMLEAAGSALLLPDEVSVDVPDDEDDDALLVYPPPAAPTYTAPPLVARALPPADDSTAPRVTAHLQVQTRGLSKIRVNGTDHAPYFFFVNTETATDGETVDAQIREAAANGIHLFSGVMYLPLRNAYGDRPFGAIDALLSQVLAADPDGYLLPRLQFVPTNFWARTHPDQLAKYSNGFEGDVSLASTEFWADCVDALDALIAHFNDPVNALAATG